MTETSEEAAGPVKAVYGRITWGAYDQIFTVEAATTQTFDCQDDHGTIVEVAAFDPKRYETTHPVKLTCTATGRFLLTKELDETFSRLAASELPEGSRSEDDVKRQSVIGELALERVNAGHIEAVLAGVPGSAGTRHRVLATLRAALNGAVKAKQITWNPCLGIGDLEPEKPVRKRERWTPAEARKFLDYVADDPFGLLYRVMVTAAPRRSELVGLRWS